MPRTQRSLLCGMT
uniref:Uncharacterized protein n=1 Tax=Anguilla anguilla TaxID=7936 RepID=A0A0E9VFW0_ANGAN